MYKNKKILAIIPARGGSKGIPQKNLQDLGGIPLIAWTIKEALKSESIDRLILSTDNQKIAETAKSFGCEVPFMRPVELATDESSTLDVIEHAILQLEEQFDFLLLLQPTSPFRRVEHIEGIIEFAFKMNAKQAVSVSLVKKHPALMYQIVANSELEPIFSQENKLTRRQDLSPVHEIDGAVYFSEISAFLNFKSFKGPGAKAFLMKNYVNIDIDEPLDLEFARGLVVNKIATFP